MSKVISYEEACELIGPFYLIGGYADLWNGTRPYGLQKAGDSFEEFVNKATDGTIYITQYEDDNLLEVKISHHDGTNLYKLLYDLDGILKYRLKEVLEDCKTNEELNEDSNYYFNKPFSRLTKEELVELFDLA